MAGFAGVAFDFRRQGGKRILSEFWRERKKAKMDAGTYISYVNHFKKFYDLSFKEKAKEYNLQMIDIHILLFVKNNPTLNTARDVVYSRSLSKSNVSNALEKLRKRNLVRLEEDSGNRRIQRIFLEPEGEAVALELKKVQALCFKRMLKGFSEEERKILNQSIGRIDENVMAALKELG